MTHRLTSVCAALVVTALAAACSSGPPDERTGTSSQAIVPVHCTTAFDTVVCPDGARYCSCESLAGPAAPPPYPAQAMTSCPGGALPSPGVAPPSALAGCTYGMGVPFATIFLCPSSMTLPQGSTCPHSDVAYRWLGGPLDNGCFGDPTDPSWAYVYEYDPCDDPGNCGAQCACGEPLP